MMSSVQPLVQLLLSAPSHSQSQSNSESHIPSVESHSHSLESHSHSLESHLQLPTYQKFLQSIVGQSLKDLRRLPTLLHEESDKLQAQLAELAVHEYRSFLAVDDAHQEIQEKLKQIQLDGQQCLQVAPQVMARCREFHREVHPQGYQQQDPQGYQQQDPQGDLHQGHAALTGLGGRAQLSYDKESIQIILKNLSPLLDLLECPALMETLVFQGYYEEAMDLDSFMHRLELRYASIPLLRSLRQRVKSVKQEMLRQLLLLLRDNINLHTCIRVIGYLRRLNVYSETQLKILFLRARSDHLMGVLEGLPTTTASTATTAASNTTPMTTNDTNSLQEAESNDASNYLRAFIDSFRSNIMDIVTQYQAIFSSSSIVTTSKHTSPDISASSILSSFVLHMMDQLLAILRKYVRKIHDTSSLSYIMTQTMHFGVALGRKGIDIRYLVCPIFETRCKEIVCSPIAEALADFRSEIKNNGMGNMVSKTGTSGMTALRLDSSSTSKSFAPPLVLLEFPPLAHVTNGYLRAWNSLRVMPMVSLEGIIAERLEESFRSLVQYLESFGQSVHASDPSTCTLTEEHRVAFISLCRVISETWAPFVVRCFREGVYGSLQNLRYGRRETGKQEEDALLTVIQGALFKMI